MFLIEDWKENPPLVHLVEALVYGLSGGKKKSVESYEDQYALDADKIYTMPIPPTLQPGSSGTTLGNLGEISHKVASLSGGRVVEKSMSELGFPAAVFDINEMRKKNEEKIEERAKRRVESR